MSLYELRKSLYLVVEAQTEEEAKTIGEQTDLSTWDSRSSFWTSIDVCEIDPAPVQEIDRREPSQQDKIP